MREKETDYPAPGVSAPGPSRGDGERADGAPRGCYRALLDNVSDMVTVSGPDGRIVYANPATERVTGYSPEEFAALGPFGLIHSEDRPRCEEVFGRLARTPGLSLELEHRFRHKDGAWRWAEGTLASLFDDPEVGGLVATVRDVTEGKRAEEALRRAAESDRFRVALADALRPLADPVEVQATASRVLGEHLGADRAYYVEVDEANGEFAVARDWRRPGAPSHAGRYPLGDWPMPWLADGETWVVRDAGSDPAIPDDQRRSYRQNGVGAAVVVPLIKAGRLVATLVVNQRTPRPWAPQEVALVEETAERTRAEVERARAEEALKESEERHRLIVEGARDYAILTADPAGTIASWSPGAEAVFGWSAEEIVGRTVEITFTPEDREGGAPEEEMATARRDGSAPDVRWHLRKDGSRAFIEGRTRALRRADGGLRGFLKIGQDVTQRRRAEEALRESEERYRLAADAAGLGRWELTAETGELVGDDVFNGQHGAPPGAHLGFKGHLQAVHPDGRRVIRRRLATALEERDGYEAVYRVVLPDGRVRWIHSRGRFAAGAGSVPDRLVGVTLDVTARRDLERERERARARKLSARVEKAERERISRELHDRVAHHMGVAHQSLELHAALAKTTPERAAEKLELARETTRLALDQTRALSAELKRMQQEELEDGLEAAFWALAESYVPDAVDVDISFSGDESEIPNPLGMQAYLAMREAIRNAVRHSGCSRIGVTLQVRDGAVVGRVEDDGEGFDPEALDNATPSWGVGLRSLRERAEMLGGSARVNSSPGTGTSVEVRVPLDGRRTELRR